VSRSSLSLPREKQYSSIPCPTCGVPVGECCERYSGAPRKEPHVLRKLAAFEARGRAENSGACKPIQSRVETYLLNYRMLSAT
jgi:hypothetical protein